MKYYMAFDLGGTNLKYAVVDREANIIEKGKFPTPKQSIEELVSLIGKTTENNKSKYEFDGIALSFPGVVDNKSGFIGGASAVPYIHGPNIRELIEKETGFRTAMENDANCAALAEVWKGVAKDAEDVLFIVVGTGIGGAIIKDRKLHTGKNLYGGEFGYMITERDYEKQQFKIWSTTASTNAIVQKAAELKGICAQELNGEMVFDMAEKGDELCQKAIDYCLMSLAEGIFALQHMFDPDMIVIGGAISAREDIIDQLNKRIDILMKNISAARLYPRIERCKFNNDANIIGAVYNYMNTFKE
ncbi:ROK family protein [Clostridiales bacterium oral taxon 876 str. F0540]|nr:ROK family protein [Clostridiales bacterium oral taxon 876 str. F0540]